MLLSKLPGVTSKNIRRIMEAVPDLYTLSKMSLSELSEVIPRADAKLLYDFLRTRGSKGKI